MAAPQDTPTTPDTSKPADTGQADYGSAGQDAAGNPAEADDQPDAETR